jgi:hypothetical protein
VGVSGVDGEAECFESSCQFVVGKVMLEAVAHIRGGGVSDGFVEIDDLAGESVEGGALFVCFLEVVGGIGRGRNGKVVYVYGGVDGMEVFETCKKYGEQRVDSEDAEWAALE